MAADDDQPEDTARKVKDLAAAFARASAPRRAASSEDAEAEPEEQLDPQTRADLERWFGLPSYQELAERPAAAAVDEELNAIRERRAKALAAVDPELVEAHRRRVEPERELPQPLPPLRTYIDPDMPLFDQSAVDRGFSIAEPREVDIPQPLIDDLRECTPQALLRDLHRAEFDFDKQFEVIDHGAGILGVDIGATVGQLMGERYGWRATASPLVEARAEFAQVFANRVRPWVDVLSTYLPNRREGLS